ncbi:DNA adenine methylase [Anabaena sp. UHCC 0399]|uniref:DNA adenine methylase n=1 Tax=Anabaena sp. UHCC 0399 TaxID=3110238 RepID=UPI002B20C1E5|nr:DNA adenine methylase [Anabaena sp. UHCC 0399]MEA5565579.1 DNA adenine methylase [Anabaena sp. UHCC 0399]
MLKSPLRYPGGKSKAINQIIEYLPESFAEFREPFIGGGSVFIYLKQKLPHLKFWINDLNQELFLFWKIAQSDISRLVAEVHQIKDKYTDGKLLFTELTSVDVNSLSDLERAVRFFVLNRITFSGTVESGGFSQEAFHKRFTYSSIERLEKLASILTPDIKITNLDYSKLINAEDENVFLFLDPPYFSATKSKLYGKDGDLHTSFDHHRFAEILQPCLHKWLITYDDSPQIRDNFKYAHIYEWELQYGMNNYKQGRAAKGKELFINNYEIKLNSEKSVNKNSINNSDLQLELDILT